MTTRELGRNLAWWFGLIGGTLFLWKVGHLGFLPALAGGLVLALGLVLLVAWFDG